MSSTFSFKGLYFTKHALERTLERGLKPSDVWAVWHNPSGSRRAVSKGAFVYYKDYGEKRIEVVVSKDPKGRWVVISVWLRERIQKRKKSFLQFLVRKLFSLISSGK
jgi:hypothetical protein